MFETIIGQFAVNQLAFDIKNAKMPPSLLFSGMANTGKGTTALELARILSCEQSANADCACSACARHAILAHPDMLCLGSRNFSAEIMASADAFAKNPEKSLVFIRAVKKLTARFAPAIWEDEPKLSKLTSLLVDIEEGVDDLLSSKPAFIGEDARRKNMAGIIKSAVKLETEGISDMLPINHIRKAAAWAHLSANGKRKTLIIENADRMQDGARNSLLKILEEPPDTLAIVLTTAREQALLPTILSRVRPYRFVQRTPSEESSIIAGVFEGEASGISAYFESFQAVSGGKLRPLAAYFAASAALIAVLNLKRPSGDLPPEIVALGKYTAPIAEQGGLGRPTKNTRQLLETVLKGAENFDTRGMFPRFLAILLDLIAESLGQTAIFSPAYLDIWRERVNSAGMRAGSYNLKPTAALNALITEVRGDLTALWSR